MKVLERERGSLLQRGKYERERLIREGHLLRRGSLLEKGSLLEGGSQSQIIGVLTEEG